jgi:UDP:flavonoid glycosyltransferase YjiC (YdhE family)
VGHEVILATHLPFEDEVSNAGLVFRPIEGNPREILESEAGLAWLEAGRNPIAGTRRLLEVARPVIHRMLTDVAEACRDADCIIYPPLGMSGYHIAERLGVPSVLASLVPLSTTGSSPVIGAPQLPLGRVYNRLTYTVAEQMGWQPFRKLVNRWRRDVLGISNAPFLGPMRQVEHLRRPILYGFSPSVVPRPNDWGPHIHVTGYWFADPDAKWRPPDELVRFLDAGPRPVYVGFGSMTDRDPAGMAKIVLGAIGRAKCRAVVLSGWAGLPGVTDRPDVHFIDNVPHEWLFPEMAAVVHHGGAGTTHFGLRAGVPTVVVPFFTDQPFWAGRVSDLGVGPKPIPRRELTVDRLAAALRQSVGDPVIRSRAEAFGRSIREEHGVARAVEVFGSLFAHTKTGACWR